MKFKGFFPTQNVVERTAKKLTEKKNSTIYSTPVSRAIKNYYPLVRNSLIAAAATVTSFVLGVGKAAFNKVAGVFLYYGFVVFFGVCLFYISRKIIYFVLQRLKKLISKKLTKKFVRKKKNKNSKST